MFKLIVASSLLVAANAAVYMSDPNARFTRQPSSYNIGGGYGGGEYSGGLGGGHGSFDAGQAGGYDGGYSFGGASQGLGHGFGGQIGGGHGFGQGGASYGSLSHGSQAGGSYGGLGHDHHGGVSIVGVGGDQKGITFDLTKNTGSGHEGTFGGSIVSSHQSGGKSQSYSDGGASASAPWAKGAEQFQGGNFHSSSSSSYGGGASFGGHGYEAPQFQQHDFSMH